MASKFPQQKLFELRERAARETERAFVAARNVVERCREELRAARLNLKAALSGRLETASRGMLARLASNEAFIKRRRAEVEDAVRDLERADEAARKAEQVFKDASVALKAIERLKATWEAEDARGRARKVETALDDLATAQHVRGGSRSR
ncbi:MAG: hypothetical protein HYY84_15015 [Deltaproteobacteria bacterium]|nr:hypothetical protein [Deltaproteobacteria bacterium]